MPDLEPDSSETLQATAMPGSPEVLGRPSAAIRLGKTTPGITSWRFWLLPRKGERLFKSRVSILLIVAVLFAQAIRSKLQYELLAKDLRNAGYIRDPITGPFSEKWFHPSDPENKMVFVFWYPRPSRSLFQKVDNLLLPDLLEWPSAREHLKLYCHFTFAGLTRPFLSPLDSRTGFDPYKDVADAFAELKKNEKRKPASAPAERAKHGTHQEQ